jgi:hypothetical protein
VTPPLIRRLIGVYDADGTLRGELSYLVKARVGLAHCALCDITHGRLRERTDWRACRAGLPVPFEVYHRDDQPSEVRRVTGGSAPVVVAETDDDRHVVVLGPSALEGCGGSPERLIDALQESARQLGIGWPG